MSCFSHPVSGSVNSISSNPNARKSNSSTENPIRNKPIDYIVTPNFKPNQIAATADQLNDLREILTIGNVLDQFPEEIVTHLLREICRRFACVEIPAPLFEGALPLPSLLAEINPVIDLALQHFAMQMNQVDHPSQKENLDPNRPIRDSISTPVTEATAVALNPEVPHETQPANVPYEKHDLLAFRQQLTILALIGNDVTELPAIAEHAHLSKQITLAQTEVLEQYRMIDRVASHMVDKWRLTRDGSALLLRFNLLPKSTT